MYNKPSFNEIWLNFLNTHIVTSDWWHGAYMVSDWLESFQEEVPILNFFKKIKLQIKERRSCQEAKRKNRIGSVCEFVCHLEVVLFALRRKNMMGESLAQL